MCILEDIARIDVKLDALGTLGRLVRLGQRLLPFLQLPLQTPLDRRAALMQRPAFPLSILEGRSLVGGRWIDLETTGLDGELPSYAALAILLIRR